MIFFALTLSLDVSAPSTSFVRESRAISCRSTRLGHPAAQADDAQLLRHGSMMLMSRRIGLAGAAAAMFRPVSSCRAADMTMARAQLDAGAEALDELLRQYDAIVAADGGNGVRRVLGKLGPTSPLHRIDKATTALARDLDDERSFDLVDEFLGLLDAADGDAYSSIFVPTGGGTTPEYWLDRSKKEIVQARAKLDRILELR